MPSANNTLQYVGDVCGPILLAATTPSGPDAAARFTLSPSTSYAGAAVVFEKVNTAAEYAAGTWTPLASVVRQDTFNVLANGAASGLTNLTFDCVVPSLYGLYAIRLRLAAISTGAIGVQAVTTARSLTDPAAFFAQMALELTRMRVGMSILTDTDLASITGTDSV